MSCSAAYLVNELIAMSQQAHQWLRDSFESAVAQRGHVLSHMNTTESACKRRQDSALVCQKGCLLAQQPCGLVPAPAEHSLRPLSHCFISSECGILYVSF